MRHLGLGISSVKCGDWTTVITQASYNSVYKRSALLSKAGRDSLEGSPESTLVIPVLIQA